MLKETTIKIAGHDYLIKKSYRSMLLFEEQTKKPISEMQKSLYDMLMLFYCIVKANNVIDFDYLKFVDILDTDINAVDKFNQYLIDSATILEEEPKVKKKVIKSSK
jgi:hypothetical protein